MDTKNQFAFFLLSVAIGFVGGLLYGLCAFVRFLFRCNRGKRKMIGFCIDLAFCLAFAFWAIFASFSLRFPDFRGYMCIGWLVGGIIYLIFLHRILAFCGKICYNRLVKVVTKAKSKEKTLQKERIEI
jgi:hypothetical protein